MTLPGLDDSVQQSHIGRRSHRREDQRLLSGGGNYISDLKLPGLLEVAFVRSPFPHALIKTIDTSRASNLNDVELVVTGSDLSGIAPFPDHLHTAREVAQLPLCVEKVRFAGAPLAAVVAQDRYIAEDGAELVEVDYEDLGNVGSVDAALDSSSPLLYPEWGSNVLMDLSRPHPEMDDLLAKLPVVRGTYTMHRHGAVPLEPRGVVSRYEGGRLSVWSSTQQPHILRSTLAVMLRMPETKVRVIVPDIGGGFGAKLHVYPEEIVIPWLALRTNRPVRWIEDRSEHLRSASQSREQRHEFEAAIADDGTIAGLRCRLIRDMGSGEIFPPGVGPSLVSAGAVSGPYRIPVTHVMNVGVVTNKTPSGAYRGYGTPEMVFALERFIEKVAAETGQDALDLRRRMMIRPEDLPYEDSRGRIIDSGSHLAAFERAIEWGEARREEFQTSSRTRVGVGYATYIEGVSPTYFGTSGKWHVGDTSSVTIEPDGSVTVASPVIAMGQGTETMIATLTADALGVGIEDVTVVLGDTDRVPFGLGSFGARSTVVAAGGVLQAAQEVREKIIRIAASRLEAAEPDIVISDSVIHVRGSIKPNLSMADIADIAYSRTFELPDGVETGLSASATWSPDRVDPRPRGDGKLNACISYSNSTHVAVVSVDVETGVVEVAAYFAVHDCGPVVNPEIVEGQIRGGVAQGIGGAILEQMLYSEDGQPLATTLMDYLLPTATDVPRIEVSHLESPSPYTPLGLKGAGEAGVTGPIAAISNAVADALQEWGVDVTETPLSPSRIREMIRNASTES